MGRRDDGPFVGGYILRRGRPSRVLAAACAGAMTLLLVAALGRGETSGYALLAIGLCNSIMFPTIFSLACEGLGERAAEGSGVMCMAIVGGAILPPLSGHLADVAGLRSALVAPVCATPVILAYGLFVGRGLVSSRARAGRGTRR